MSHVLKPAIAVMLKSGWIAFKRLVRHLTRDCIPSECCRIELSRLNLAGSNNTIMGLLSYDPLSHGGEGTRELASRLNSDPLEGLAPVTLHICVDPWRTAAALATMNGDSK